MSDPPRWSDPGSDAPQGARELLASARRPRMSPEARARSAARVASLGSGGGSGGRGSGGDGGAAGTGSWLRALGKATVGLAVVAGGVIGVNRAMTPAGENHASSRAAVAAPALVAPVSSVAPVAPPRAEDRVPAAREEPPPTSTAAPAAEGAVAAAQAPAAPSPPAAEHPAPRPPSPGEERRMLEEARHAIGTNPGLSLERVREHARVFPRSPLAEEREFIAVRALIAARRGAEARARGERFVARYPNGIYTAMVRRLLEGGR